jgi:hypothetical protein
MKQPKILADPDWRQSKVEILILFALTTMATTLLLDMHWLVAASISPFVMLAMLLAVMVFVQVSWMLIVGLDKVGNAIGLRKSPLS